MHLIDCAAANLDLNLIQHLLIDQLIAYGRHELCYDRCLIRCIKDCLFTGSLKSSKLITIVNGNAVLNLVRLLRSQR